ncbi:unnamed protein product [Sphenostylis stenocarpa]|uniref:Protein MULTIPOLAR SPINDLE 1 n=1 Tax=Sphenostylis stenocarpa TaxID=92480 RepID=A0AA86VEP0_9FABA|nr:unnamed protein product [Sphenostylis stenocarpa]
MAEKEAASGKDESLKLAVAISLLRSKILKNANESSALSPSQSDALLRWKRKAKERKQEILRLREDLKDAQDASHCDLFPESAACKCYFFDNFGELNPKHHGTGCDNRFSDVLQRRFLRQVRFKERRRIIDSSASSSGQQRLSLGLIKEDETEQLRASVDFLVELCSSPSPVDGSKFANFAHQAVDFILATINTTPGKLKRGQVACEKLKSVVSGCCGQSERLSEGRARAAVQEEGATVVVWVGHRGDVGRRYGKGQWDKSAKIVSGHLLLMVVVVVAVSATTVVILIPAMEIRRKSGVHEDTEENLLVLTTTSVVTTVMIYRMCAGNFQCGVIGEYVGVGVGYDGKLWDSCGRGWGCSCATILDRALMTVERIAFSHSPEKLYDELEVTLKNLLSMGRTQELVEGIINSLVARLIRQMCTSLSENGSQHTGTNAQFCIQHLIRKLGSEPYIGQRAILSVCQRILVLAERLLFSDPFDDGFPKMHECIFIMIQLIEFLVADYLLEWSKAEDFDNVLLEDWVTSIVQARKALELLESRSGLYALYMDRVTGELAKQLGGISVQHPRLFTSGNTCTEYSENFKTSKPQGFQRKFQEFDYSQQTRISQLAKATYRGPTNLRPRNVR